MTASSGEDRNLLDRQQQFYEELEKRFRYFIDLLFPANARGQHIPILMQVLSDPHQEWMQLNEIARRSQAVKQGLLQPDSQTQAYDANKDNAQQRLAELNRQFASEAE